MFTHNKCTFFSLILGLVCTLAQVIAKYLQESEWIPVKIHLSELTYSGVQSFLYLALSRGSPDVLIK